MTTYYLNGTQIVEGSDITVNGFSYPYSWLEGTDAAVRASLGIDKFGDQNFDTTYYWNKDVPKSLVDVEEVDTEGNPIFIKTLVDGVQVDTDIRLVTPGLKTVKTSEVKQTANTLLAPSDYLIIRNAVEGSDIPEKVSAYRAAIVTEQDRVVSAISEVSTVEELIEVMNSISWQIKPDVLDPDAGLISE